MRVLLTNLPPLLRDILREAVAGESDMTVVGGAATDDLETLVRRSSPDIVILQATPDAAQRVFETLGGIAVVAIDPQATHAVVLGADAPAALNDVSPTTIIMAIRRAG
jgi:DNA-binding NarL/FixJ family response regulator